MVLRGLTVLAALVIGICYGVLCGALTFLLWRLTHDPAYPGPMIPDQNGWGRFVTFMTAVSTGFCAALVGLIVSLRAVSKTRGGAIGFAVGLTAILLNYYDAPSYILKLSWSDLLSALGVLGANILFFPIGLAAIGIVVSFMASKMK